MLQHVVNGISLLEKEPEIICENRKPYVRVAENLVIDDTILQKPLLLIGEVGSGKSRFLMKKPMTQILAQMKEGDVAVISAPKREMTEHFYRPENGDVLISYDAREEKDIWNMFAELEASDDVRKTIYDLGASVFCGRENQSQPFFSDAARDTFESLLLYMFRNYEKKTGKKPTNASFYGFVESLSMQDQIVNGRVKKGLVTLIQEAPELHCLDDYYGDGRSAQALGVRGEFRNAVRSVFQGGAFVRSGSFSVRQKLAEGGRVFLQYDMSELTEAGIRYFEMILDQFIKEV